MRRAVRRRHNSAMLPRGLPPLGGFAFTVGVSELLRPVPLLREAPAGPANWLQATLRESRRGHAGFAP
jgi:hypothetical protein